MIAVFTSSNAVAGIRSCLDNVPGWDIAVIEGKTQQAAETFFGKAAIKATARDAGALAAALISRNINAVVFFCGNRRLDHLPLALARAGIDVREIVVYETEETPVAIDGIFDGILFFSPSAVTSFFRANTLPADCTIFVIGSTTAKTLTSYTSNKIIISPANDERAMIEEVIKYYNEERLIT